MRLWSCCGVIATARHTPHARFWRFKCANASDLSQAVKGWGDSAVEWYTLFLNTFLSALSIPVPGLLWQPTAGSGWGYQPRWGRKKVQTQPVKRGKQHSGVADDWRRGVHRARATLTPRVSNPHTAGPGCQGRAPPLSHSPPAPTHATHWDWLVTCCQCSQAICWIGLSPTAMLDWLVTYCHSSRGQWFRIAQLTEHRTQDQKDASLNLSRRIFFSRITFLCWFIFGICHPMTLQWHVNAVACNRPSTFCQNGRLHLYTQTFLTQPSQSGLTTLSRHSSHQEVLGHSCLS